MQSLILLMQACTVSTHPPATTKMQLIIVLYNESQAAKFSSGDHPLSHIILKKELTCKN